MRNSSILSSNNNNKTTNIISSNNITTTVFRSCTEFSHERSKHPLSSSTIVSKLLIQPAHLKNNSISYWPNNNNRNQGATLLHACEHFSILPTISIEKNKQLIASPSNHSCCSPPSTINYSLRNQKSYSPTKMPCTSTSPSSLQQQQIASFSPNSVGSTSSPCASTGSVGGRPLRVAQPPSLSTIAFNQQQGPCTSFPVSSSNYIPSQQKQHQQQSSLSNQQKQQNLPPPSNSHSNQRFGRLSYSELLELARNQQRQIEANEAELDERRKAVALFGVARRTAGSEREQQQNAHILMSNIRSQIERDEKELVKIGHYRREAHKLREYNNRQSKDLHKLESEYSNNEQELRRIAAKVDSLREQLELFYMKRATNASDEKNNKRFLNSGTTISSSPQEKQQNERRPKASISPFNKFEKGIDIPDYSEIKTSKINHSSPTKNHQIPTNSNFNNTQNSTTTKIQWRRELPSNNEINNRQQQFNNNNNYQQFSPSINSNSGLLPPAVDKISLRRNSINQAKRNSLVGENGGDEHVQALLLAELRRGRSHISFGRSWDSSQLSDEFRTTTNNYNNKKEKREKEEEEINKLLLSEEEEKDSKYLNNKKDEEESINLLLQQNQKQQNHLNYLQQQQKIISPKTSPKRATLPAENSIDAFNKIFNKQESKIIKKYENDEDDDDEEEENKNFIEKEEEKEIENNNNNASTSLLNNENGEEKKENSKKELIEKEEEEDDENKNNYKTINLLDRINIDLDNNNLNNIKENNDEIIKDEIIEYKEEIPKITNIITTGSPPLSDSSTVSSSELEREGILELFDDSWHKNIRPFGIKGILKEKQQKDLLNSNKRLETKKQTNRVKIDLVILFLDVAYEGQYEMLVQLASQIDDISVSNSEGLTALHYAICASNHDIVQFLVENGADVNALDVDGWTPLHCAASCGNLPMIKLLIEYGACPIATTISKSETVAQIFDDSNENASIGIEYMAFVEECMGVVNDAKVYAAYSYDPQREDELSFKEGDELRVLRKCEHNENEENNNSKINEEKNHSEEECDEQCWWLCEHTKNVSNNDQKSGFVPRNYLALFPTLKHRKQFIVDFQLPKELIFTYPEQSNNQTEINREDNDDERKLIENEEKSSKDNQERICNNVLRINQNGNNNKNNNNTNSLGHQELSTYA